LRIGGSVGKPSFLRSSILDPRFSVLFDPRFSILDPRRNFRLGGDDRQDFGLYQPGRHGRPDRLHRSCGGFFFSAQSAAAGFNFLEQSRERFGAQDILGLEARQLPGRGFQIGQFLGGWAIRNQPAMITARGS
jgi:hypothetical protein